MSVHADDVTGRISTAMGMSNPADIISGVKAVVADEVGTLSPDVKVVYTSYFNHTYMPDLMVEWSDAGKINSRPVFLRTTLRPAAREADVDSLEHRDPIVLSLSPTVTAVEEFDGLRSRARQASRVLVTDMSSLAEIAAPAATQLAGRAMPLLKLVQTNLLKGGRGLLTSEDAQRLASTALPTDADAPTAVTSEFLDSFDELADELFAPDAALRLRRSAELLRFGLTGDVIENLTLTEGQLSDVELRVLLPYLLAEPTAQANSALWEFIGSMMSLERLEEMWDALVGVDVTPLVVANSSTWSAKRSQLVINSSADPAEADPQEFEAAGQQIEPATKSAFSEAIPQVESDVSEPGPQVAAQQPERTAVPHASLSDEVLAPGWTITSHRVLRGVAGPWLLYLATDSRRLKGRQDSRPARWDELSDSLTPFALDAVELRGLSRRIAVRAEESGDVAADVRQISSTIEDSFQLTEVSVRVPGQDGVMDVDFTSMTVTAKPRSSLASLISASTLLAVRTSPDLEALLGTANGDVAPEEATPAPDDGPEPPRGT